MNHKLSTVFLIGIIFLGLGVGAESAVPTIFYGEVFFHNDTTPAIVDITDTTTYFNFTNWTEGAVFGFQMEPDNTTLTALVGGLFRVDYSISFLGNRQEFQTVIKINEVEQLNTESHRTIANQNDQGNVGGTGFISISSGDQITFGVKNVDTPVSDAQITSINMNVFRVNKIG